VTLQADLIVAQAIITGMRRKYGPALLTRELFYELPEGELDQIMWAVDRLKEVRN
jgi:hypothetical protein